MTSPNTPDKPLKRLGDCAFSAPSLSSFGSSPSASLPVSPPSARRSTIAGDVTSAAELLAWHYDNPPERPDILGDFIRDVWGRPRS